MLLHLVCDLQERMKRMEQQQTANLSLPVTSPADIPVKAPVVSAEEFFVLNAWLEEDANRKSFVSHA